VREMRPKTFVANIVSMSLSCILPTMSVPWAPPALLTAAMVFENAASGTEVGELTEYVDIAEVLRYFGPQRRHLRSICHVELHDGDLPALLYASRLVRGARSLCDFHQLVGSAREEYQV
jgi:hypothetical protein